MILFFIASISFISVVVHIEWGNSHLCYVKAIFKYFLDEWLIIKCGTLFILLYSYLIFFALKISELFLFAKIIEIYCSLKPGFYWSFFC